MNLASVNNKLLSMRREILAKSAKSRGKSDGHLKEDDLVHESCPAAVLSHLNRQATSALSLIDAALARIERGTYGLCRDCGEEIKPARLNARPHALTCLDCAEKASTTSSYRKPEQQGFSSPSMITVS